MPRLDKQEQVCSEAAPAPCQSKPIVPASKLVEPASRSQLYRPRSRLYQPRSQLNRLRRRYNWLHEASTTGFVKPVQPALPGWGVSSDWCLDFKIFVCLQSSNSLAARTFWRISTYGRRRRRKNISQECYIVMKLHGRYEVSSWNSLAVDTFGRYSTCGRRRRRRKVGFLYMMSTGCLLMSSDVPAHEKLY